MNEKSLLPGCVLECPGCQHREKSADQSISLKRATIERALAGVIPSKEEGLRIAFHSPIQRVGYRKRALLHCRSTEDGLKVGVLGRTVSWRELPPLIEIPNCPVQDPELNKRIARLRVLLKDFSTLHGLLVQGSGSNWLCGLLFKQKEDHALAERFQGFDWTGFDSVWVHQDPSLGRRMYSVKNWTLIKGPRLVEGLDPWGERFVFGPTSFQQTHTESHRRAIDQAVSYLERHKLEGALLDGHAGGGVVARRLRRCLGSPIVAVELSGESEVTFRVNLPEARFLRGRLSERLRQIEAMEIGSVFLNPPRLGLEPEVIDWLCDLLPGTPVVYLSCEPRSLARDLARLVAHFDIRSVEGFDFFPLTSHCEVLVCLQRKRGD